MPVIPVAGSERFAESGQPLPESDRFGEVVLHQVDDQAVAGVDPLTYEVIRHRLVAITDDMGEAVKRMSGSVVVTDCNDFGTGIMDETGETVQVGLYNMQLGSALDMAVRWTLQHRSSNPGIRPGDQFLLNDPWVGGGLHQNDVTVLAPLFHQDKLFCWTSVVAHQVDLGGVSPGSWSVEGHDVFWESLPIPPVKMVEGGVLRSDMEDMYLRRSRVPRLVGLDLRAKIGANNVAQDRLTALIDSYGPDTVKAVMKKMMSDAETQLRTKLTELPNGTWSAVAHQDGARAGDREIHKIVVAMTKQDDTLTFDFTGTDPQVDGIINCTYAGLRGGILPILLTMLCPDMSWSPGGILRCVDIVSEPRHDQQLHLSRRDRQGLGQLRLGDPERRVRNRCATAEHPSRALPVGDERLFGHLRPGAAGRGRPARSRIRHHVVRFDGRRPGRQGRRRRCRHRW